MSEVFRVEAVENADFFQVRKGMILKNAEFSSEAVGDIGMVGAGEVDRFPGEEIGEGRMLDLLGIFECMRVAGENAVDIRGEEYFLDAELLREKRNERIPGADRHAPGGVEDHVAVKHRDGADPESVFYRVGCERLEFPFAIDGDGSGIDACDRKIPALENLCQSRGEGLIECVVFEGARKFFRGGFRSLRETMGMRMEVSERADAMNEDEPHFFRIVGLSQDFSDSRCEGAAKFGLGSAFYRENTPADLENVDFFHMTKL